MSIPVDVKRNILLYLPIYELIEKYSKDDILWSILLKRDYNIIHSSPFIKYRSLYDNLYNECISMETVFNFLVESLEKYYT